MLVVCTVLLGFRMDMLVGHFVGILSARGYFLALVPFETWLPAIESSTLCRAWRAFIGAYIPNAEVTTTSQTAVDETEIFVESESVVGDFQEDRIQTSSEFPGTGRALGGERDENDNIDSSMYRDID